MKVILTANIKNIGEKGDLKEVKPGYARNFLYPKGLAVASDSVLGQEMLAKKESEAEKQQEEISKVAEIANKNQGLEISFARKASSEGKLFGSVSFKEIKAAAEEKIKIKVESMTPSTSVKEVGDHKYSLSLPGSQTLDVIIRVSALGQNKQ